MEFLKNYKASLNFLDYLEGSEEVKHFSNICCSMSFSFLMFLIIVQGYCPSRSAVSKFRMEPVYIEFMKQWNTGVYFSLRYALELFMPTSDPSCLPGSLSLVISIKLNKRLQYTDIAIRSLSQVSGNSWGFGFCTSDFNTCTF